MNFLSRIISAALMIIIFISGIWLELILNEYRCELEDKRDLIRTARAVNGAGRVSSDNDYEPAAPDIAELRREIPDIKAWITLEGSHIDYPVVQGDDNDQYIHTTVYGQYSKAGSIFIDAGNISPFRDFNTVIYGHHMLSGSMFTGLKEFRNKEYFDKHKKFRLITDRGDYDLWVAAFLHESADSDAYTTFFADGQEKDDFVTFINERAYYRSDVPIDRTSHLVTLSTCAYEWKGARYIVVGKLEEHSNTESGTASHKVTYRSEQTDGRRSAVNPWFAAMICIDMIMLLIVIIPVIRSRRYRYR